LITRTDVKSDAFAARAHAETCVGVRSLDPNESIHCANRIEEARLFLDLSNQFRENGWPDKAKRFAVRALAIFEREAGAYHPDVVRVLLCLAAAREDLGDYTRAGADYRRANDILDLTADPRNLETERLRIQTIRGLANVIRALGRDQQAETMLKDALVLAERTFGCQNGEVAGALNDLGVHYRHTGAYEKASRLHHRALSIAEITLGFEHAQTAAILHELGVVEHARGQFAAGEPFARRSADIRQKTFGTDHPQVAAEFALIGALLEGQGKYDEAESLYQRALTIVERWFGPDHPEVATIANHLARVPGRERDASVVTMFRSSGLTAAV
jgi:tetratricopeptide (TPR) repeat protein